MSSETKTSFSPVTQKYAGEAEAESSKSAFLEESQELNNGANTSEQEDSDADTENKFDGAIGEGMLPDGYSGLKIVKPLTPEALAAFKAAQDQAGVVYISRIPPGMRPAKVRHLMSAHGEVGRVYLQQEGDMTFLVSLFYSSIWSL